MKGLPEIKAANAPAPDSRRPERARLLLTRAKALVAPERETFGFVWEDERDELLADIERYLKGRP